MNLCFIIFNFRIITTNCIAIDSRTVPYHRLNNICRAVFPSLQLLSFCSFRFNVLQSIIHSQKTFFYSINSVQRFSSSLFFAFVSRTENYFLTQKEGFTVRIYLVKRVWSTPDFSDTCYFSGFKCVWDVPKTPCYRTSFFPFPFKVRTKKKKNIEHISLKMLSTGASVYSKNFSTF